MTDFAGSLVSLASLAFLWVLLFWFYKDLCIELFRQKMFALREELFDAAASGEIPFDHKAYGRLRLTMNGAIRYAHHITLAQFFLLSLGQRREQHRLNYNDQMQKEMRDLNSKQVEKFAEINRKFALLLLKQIFVSSPVFIFTIIMPVLSYFFFLDVASWLLRHLKLQIEDVQSMAYAAGDDRSLSGSS